MTINRVKHAAYIRNINFDGEKKFRNNTIGYGYEVYLPDKGFVLFETLDQVYNSIMKYERVI
jgi:hypothetical protein